MAGPAGPAAQRPAQRSTATETSATGGRAYAHSVASGPEPAEGRWITGHAGEREGGAVSGATATASGHSAVAKQWPRPAGPAVAAIRTLRAGWAPNAEPD